MKCVCIYMSSGSGGVLLEELEVVEDSPCVKAVVIISLITNHLESRTAEGSTVAQPVQN